MYKVMVITTEEVGHPHPSCANFCQVLCCLNQRKDPSNWPIINTFHWLLSLIRPSENSSCLNPTSDFVERPCNTLLSSPAFSGCKPIFKEVNSVMIGRIISWFTLRAVVPIKGHLNSTAYLSIVNDCIWFMTRWTHPLVTISSRRTHCVS